MEEKKPEEVNLGWECPRCGSVNAPQKDRCQCVKTESVAEPKPQLLVE